MDWQVHYQRGDQQFACPGGGPKRGHGRSLHPSFAMATM